MKALHIVHAAGVPVRGVPQDSAEMVTQLLFGDMVEVIAVQGNWRQVQGLADGYTGWVDHKLLWPLERQVAGVTIPCYGLTAQVTRAGRRAEPVHLPAGARLPVTAMRRGWLQADLPGLQVRLPDFTGDVHKNPEGQDVIRISEQFLGAPYLWGGKTVWGIDCSGLTQVCGRIAQLELLRDASQQVTQGKQVEFTQRRGGDLAFFRNAAGNITHVGIVLPRGRIRHAHGWVRDDLLTTQGIVNPAGELTHTLDCIKRFT